MRRDTRLAAWVAAAAVIARSVVACGARTELAAGFAESAALPDASSELPDAADSSVQDRRTADVVSERTLNERNDVASKDAALDAISDVVGEEDAFRLPPIDAAFDSSIVRCPDGGPSTIYLVSSAGNFYRFNLQTVSATLLGPLACETRPGTGPFTMAASATGVVYVLYSTGALFAVNPSTLACSRTPLDPSTIGFPGNVGVATLGAGSGERLFVYGCLSDGGPCAPALARSDLTTFTLTLIGLLSPNPEEGYPVDLKGDAKGRLFALDSAGTLIEIDPATATVKGKDETGQRAAPSWALLSWNNDLYIFTQAQGVVRRFDLETKTATTLGSVGDEIVGAAAAACVP